MQQVSRCPNCGSPVVTGQRFCGICGASQSAGCAYCGSQLNPGTKFCANCGSPVGGGVPQQPVGMPPQQPPGWGQQPQQPPGWGQQPPAWGPPAPRSQPSSMGPVLILVLVFLLVGIGGIVYWQFGDYLAGLFSSSTTATGGTGPTITNIAASTANTSVIITWKTGKLSSSQVEYGTTTNYGTSTTISNDPTSDGSIGIISHYVTITGLDADTTYHYRIKSKDKDGNRNVSEGKTFATGSAE